MTLKELEKLTTKKFEKWLYSLSYEEYKNLPEDILEYISNCGYDIDYEFIGISIGDIRIRLCNFTDGNATVELIGSDGVISEIGEVKCYIGIGMKDVIEREFGISNK